MEQHPVPQNVTSFQFRLVGDMTIKQFGYLAGGAILGYISFKLPLPFFFTWPMAALFALGGFGFAFIPIEERPMDVWFFSFIKSVYSPTQFLWQKTAPVKHQDNNNAVTQPADIISHNPLNSFIGKLLDKFLPVPSPKKQTPAAPVPQSAPIPPVAVAGHTQSPVQNFQTTPEVRRETQPQAQQAEFALRPVIPHGINQAPAQTAAPVKKNSVSSPKIKTPSLGISSFFTQLFSLLTPAKKQGQQVPVRTTHTASSPHPFQPVQPFQAAAQPGSKVLAKGPASLFDWFFDIFRPAQQQTVIPAGATSFTFPNMFNAPPSQPVTGKHLDVVENAPAPAQPVPSPEEEQKQRETQTKALELESQVKNLTQELQTKQMSEGRILELQKQLMEALEHKNKMEQELVSLRQQLSQKKEQAQTTYRQATIASQQEEPKSTVKVITPDMAVKAGLPRLTTFPNVVTGIIKDNQGNLLPGILVTVKDKEDIPVRALKTNKLGQFAASTPLANGVYTIDIEDPKGIHLFDRVRITLNGSVLSPVEVIARTKKEMDRAKLAAELFGPAT